MLNMLVVEDNIYFAKLLINKIIQSNNNIRLCMIATDGEEALNIIKKREKIDVILLDLKIPKFSGIQILEFLEKTKKEEYKRSVIVVSGDMKMIEKIRNNSLVFNYISKTQVLDEVVKQVNEISDEKEFVRKKIQKLKEEKIKIVKKINTELANLGYNIKYIGTGYLSDAIYLIYSFKNRKNIKLERDIYPIIARNNNTTANTVKCDIIRATNQIRNNIKSQEIKKYFGWFIDEKIRPKAVMNVILKKLKQEI